ncbi:hypothetical protein [Flexivirga meconopsidis]|uniref:hypothetical protein n=1 Tax=Flexivirga meconopsidis TaxID=2977121 RepID=UPI00223F8EE3|nr:hypothetical protein [Flexivirga meconopsidis]
MDTTFTQLLDDYLPEGVERPLDGGKLFVEFGMDSMATLGLYIAVERGYGIKLSPGDIASGKLGTIDGLWGAIAEATAQPLDVAS